MIQPDGRILVSTYSSDPPNGQLPNTAGNVGRANSSFDIVRFTANGQQRDAEKKHDLGDGNNSGGDAAAGIAIQENGDILMVGRFRDGDWPHYTPQGIGTLRLNELLETEAEFNIDLSGSAFVNSSLELPDGKVLLVGTDNGDVLVTRHLPTGEHDLSFGDGGFSRVPMLNATGEGYRATLAQDGKILITGHAYNGKNNDIIVIRLNHNGTLDTTFDADGKMSVDLFDKDDRGYAIAVTADNKIIVAGKSGNDMALFRLLGDSNQSEQAVNQIPVITVPGPQNATVDQPFAFTAYRDNLISIADADAGENHVKVTLGVDSGTLTLVHDDPGGGLTYTTTSSNNDGFEDQDLSFTGTIEDINTALNWVSFTPQPSNRVTFVQWTAEKGGNDHWYEYVSGRADWDTAKADAEVRGGHLTTIHSEAENDFVWKMLYPYANPSIWLGALQPDGIPRSEPLGNWNWVTDETWEANQYTNWKDGEPNDTTARSQNHLAFDGSGAWYDESQNSQLGYLVEYINDPRKDPITEATFTISVNDHGHAGLGSSAAVTANITIDIEEAPAPLPSLSGNQPASLDSTFDGDGKKILTEVTELVDAIYEMRVLEGSDANAGKILAVGAINDCLGLLRLNADLTLDSSFGANGNGIIQTEVDNGDHGRALTLDKHNNILVAGGNKIGRFNSDGSLDTDFGSNGYSDILTSPRNRTIPTDIVIQPDGRILVSTYSSDPPNGQLPNTAGNVGRANSSFDIVRFTANGQQRDAEKKT